MAYQYRGTVRDLDAPLMAITPEAPTPRPKPSGGCHEAKGTKSGYRRHQKASEPACDECKAAIAAYAKEYRAKVRNGERVIRKGFTPDRCGTYAGYTHHNRHAIPACQPCRDAYSAYMTAWRNRRKAAA